MTLSKDLYTAHATATGGREGHSASDDGVLDVDLAVPKEMGGPGGATNPEQLFAAGYAACFQSALGTVGRRQKVDTSQSRVRTEVTLGVAPEGAFGLRVGIHVSIPGVGAETAQQLTEAAHQVCPYSNATRGNVEVALSADG
ncbi:MAG TPA: organic hydroperoxide resistance protein [Acidimicrobiales bacterium]|nr:organic hydroperoxide resistance protein [Acidimicrobiales bacterium]